jgi:hypothetical protein
VHIGHLLTPSAREQKQQDEDPEAIWDWLMGVKVQHKLRTKVQAARNSIESHAPSMPTSLVIESVAAIVAAGAKLFPHDLNRQKTWVERAWRVAADPNQFSVPGAGGKRIGRCSDFLISFTTSPSGTPVFDLDDCYHLSEGSRIPKARRGRR